MTPQHDPIRVWDLPTRLFHWAVVLLVALQYASGEFGWPSMEWHYRCGYALIALVAFRLLWGFAGSQTSRFGDFVRGPRVALRYVAALLRGGEAPRAGHNPLGGWSVIAMLASIALQAVSGLFSSDDISEDGPLVARASGALVSAMTRIHHWNRWVLLALIVLHLVAIGAYALRGTNLLAPMLSGRARIAVDRPLSFAPTWLAVLLLALCAGAVIALVAWGEAA